MKEDLQKALILFYFFFLNLVSFNQEDQKMDKDEKQKEPGTSDQLLLRLQSKLKKILY